MGGVGAGLRSGGAAAVFGANMGEPPKKGEKTNKHEPPRQLDEFRLGYKTVCWD